MADLADSELGVPEDEEAARRHSRSPTGVALRRLLRKKIAVLSLIVIIGFYSMGIAAPILGKLGVIPPYAKQDLSQSLHGPSRAHPFGTDRLGRDQLSRVMWSGETTVLITIITLFTGSLVLGLGLGLLAGYAGGWIDTVIMRVGDVFISLPSLLMMILINATLKDQVHHLGTHVEHLTGISGIVKSGAPDYILIFGALSVFSWVGIARVVRAQVLALRETEFVMAAKALGAPTSHILIRHLLPNVSNIIIVTMSIGLAGIAGSEIALTWFGIGIQPPHPSFGAMLSDGDAISIRALQVHPYMLAFPGGVVASLFFAFNLLGDALTDVLTPRAR